MIRRAAHSATQRRLTCDFGPDSTAIPIGAKFPATRRDLLQIMKPSALTTDLIRPTVARLASLHGDERGVISIMTVFTIFVLTIVLGRVINAGRQWEFILSRKEAEASKRRQ